MPLTQFEQLPDHARLWVFPGSRALHPDEAPAFLESMDQFLDQWTAHKVPLATARDWRYDQFLLVAVDESAAGASGCSIDTLVRFMRELEGRMRDVTFTNNAPVWYRAADGAIRSVSRPAFQQLVSRGEVGPDTIVFDNTLVTVGALREGRWEVPAAKSWHARAFGLGSGALR